MQTENHAQKGGQNCYANCNANESDETLALQNHAQNQPCNANNAYNANLHVINCNATEKKAVQNYSGTGTEGQKFLSCPFEGCRFMNIRQEEIDVHYRLTQNQPNFI
ncbi:MAG TPA: hypothetical protein VH415_11720 [Nitrososphaeraceae archaeon]|jgi:hypothetical protein